MTIIAGWALVKTGAGRLFELLRLVPWWAWLALAVLAAGWRWGEHRHDVGVEAERARWIAAQAKADAKAKSETERRDRAAQAVNADASKAATAAVTDTRVAAASAAERIRYVTRSMPIPSGCPHALPASVRDELARAAERAATAGNPLRAGRDDRSDATAGGLAAGWAGLGAVDTGRLGRGAAIAGGRACLPAAAPNERRDPMSRPIATTSAAPETGSGLPSAGG